MAEVEGETTETSRLLPNGHVARHETGLPLEDSGVDWIIVIAIGFTWFASFLAALGEYISFIVEPQG